MKKLFQSLIAGILSVFLFACDGPTAPPPQPGIEILSPTEITTTSETYEVEFVVSDEIAIVGAAVRVGDALEQPIPLEPTRESTVRTVVDLIEGENRIVVSARNWSGITSTAEIIVEREVLFEADFVATFGVAPGNVLSTRISYTVPKSDSVQVHFWSDLEEVETTPFTVPSGETDALTILGLLPATTYEYEIHAYAQGKRRRSLPGSFETAELPSALQNVRLRPIRGAPSRYSLTTVNPDDEAFAVAFDASGRIVWYSEFFDRGEPVGNAMPQPNGNLTAFFGGSHGWQPTEGYFLEFTPEGEVVRTYDLPGYFMDMHDIQLTGAPDAPTAHFFTYILRQTDLSSIGGRSDVLLAGHQLIRQSPGGGVEFLWDGWEHIGIEEWIGDEDQKAERTNTDYAHPNSLTFDAAGNYIVSWRNMNQIMALDRGTGAVQWRVGGLYGEYEFVNDPWDGFSKQHAAHVLPNGNLLLYDNGTDVEPKESRAVEYELDHDAKTATLVWEYRHSPPLYTAFVGYVHRLANGNTWVAFSFGGRVVEVEPDGDVVWEGQLEVAGQNALAYRVVPIESLYGPSLD